MADKFLITEADKQGPTWPRIERHLKQRLDDLRVQNDAFSLDETKTAALRGRIAEITALLSAANEKGDGVATTKKKVDEFEDGYKQAVAKINAAAKLHAESLDGHAVDLHKHHTGMEATAQQAQQAAAQVQANTGDAA